MTGVLLGFSGRRPAATPPGRTRGVGPGPR